MLTAEDPITAPLKHQSFSSVEGIFDLNYQCNFINHAHYVAIATFKDDICQFNSLPCGQFLSLISINLSSPQSTTHNSPEEVR